MVNNKIFISSKHIYNPNHVHQIIYYPFNVRSPSRKRIQSALSKSIQKADLSYMERIQKPGPSAQHHRSDYLISSMETRIDSPQSPRHADHSTGIVQYRGLEIEIVFHPFWRRDFSFWPISNACGASQLVPSFGFCNNPVKRTRMIYIQIVYSHIIMRRDVLCCSLLLSPLLDIWTSDT